jgi:hypothetical protein
MLKQWKRAMISILLIALISAFGQACGSDEPQAPKPT